MHKALIGASAALVLSLAACGGTDRETAAETAVANGAESVANRLEAMPEGQRKAVFIRAIQDAGQECQHVESSQRAGEHQGFPVWNATCAGGGTWTIVVREDGTANVLNAAEARLVGGNQSATEDGRRK
ncbi:MAG TPA: hypothetical protein VF704_02310 [Allosphingosinicella sp.]